jgi:hypothetical protein
MKLIVIMLISINKTKIMLISINTIIDIDNKIMMNYNIRFNINKMNNNNITSPIFQLQILNKNKIIIIMNRIHLIIKIYKI